MSKTYLYRLFDADDRLLYVGISWYAPTRLGTHHRSAPWRSEIARHAVAEYPSRREAAFAESEAINIEFPLYNKQGRRSEPKSVTIARKEAAEAAKKAARQAMRRSRKSLEATKERHVANVIDGRRAGMSLAELSDLSGLSYDEVRKIAARLKA